MASRFIVACIPGAVVISCSGVVVVEDVGVGLPVPGVSGVVVPSCSPVEPRYIEFIMHK